MAEMASVTAKEEEEETFVGGGAIQVMSSYVILVKCETHL